MVIIEEEKLEEMVRHAVKVEMETILTRFGKVMDSTVSEAVKKELGPILTKREPESAVETKYLYSIKELAKYMHCCVRTVQNMKNSGLLPYKQIGRKVLFNSDEVLKAMEPTRRRPHR